MSEQRIRVEPRPPQPFADTGDVAASPAREESDTAEQAKARAQQAAAPAKEKAREVAGEARSHAQAAAGQAKDKASAQLDAKSTQAGERIGSQAKALEGVAGELRNQGRDGAAQIAEQAAEKVKDVGDYLEQADGQELAGAAQKMARENPAAAAAVGAAAGFAAGRVLKVSKPDGSPEEDEQSVRGS